MERRAPLQMHRKISLAGTTSAHQQIQTCRRAACHSLSEMVGATWINASPDAHTHQSPDTREIPTGWLFSTIDISWHIGTWSTKEVGGGHTSAFDGSSLRKNGRSAKQDTQKTQRQKERLTDLQFRKGNHLALSENTELARRMYRRIKLSGICSTYSLSSHAAVIRRCCNGLLPHYCHYCNILRRSSLIPKGNGTGNDYQI